jgi:hypothetical protein
MSTDYYSEPSYGSLVRRINLPVRCKRTKPEQVSKTAFWRSGCQKRRKPSTRD